LNQMWFRCCCSGEREPALCARVCVLVERVWAVRVVPLSLSGSDMEASSTKLSLAL
jgi:hypothetical protein